MRTTAARKRLPFSRGAALLCESKAAEWRAGICVGLRDAAVNVPSPEVGPPAYLFSQSSHPVIHFNILR